MSRQELSVQDPDSGKPVLQMSWENGDVLVNFAVSEGLREEVAEIVERGVIEWVEDAQGTVQRVTPAEDWTFLMRLGDDLSRQFRFEVKVTKHTVIERITGGESLDPARDIREETEQWRRLGDPVPLGEWLGMHAHEYEAFERAPERLALILAGRVRGLSLATVTRDFGVSGMGMAARRCPPDIARLIVARRLKGRKSRG